MWSMELLPKEEDLLVMLLLLDPDEDAGGAELRLP